MKSLRSQGIPVVTVFLSGRALWVNPELNASDAFVAAWLPGSEGQGVADVLFCKSEDFATCGFKGKTSFSWPKTINHTPLNLGDSLYDPLFKFAHGLEYGQISELEQLEERSNQKTVSAIGQTFFKGRGIPPFSAVIQEQGLAPVSASQPPSQTTNQGVSTKVFDRKLQEDAQRIVFNGKGLNSWQLQSSKTINWQNELKQQAVLSFDVKVLKSSDQPLYVSMVCGSGCNGSLTIDDKFIKPDFKNWQSVGVPLECFEKNGAELANVPHPIVFLPPGDWSFEISDIRLLEKHTRLDYMDCE